MHFELLILSLYAVSGYLVLFTTAKMIHSPNSNWRNVKILKAGETFNHTSSNSELNIFCYNGEKRSLRRLFESVVLRLDIDNDYYTQYIGSTVQEVKKHYDEQRSLFSFNLFTQKRPRLQLSPFTTTCLGIETAEPYRIILHRLHVDFWRVLQLIIGYLLFHYAGSLSQNTLFYYITGVLLGVCLSFMLLIYFGSKLLPRRSMMYGVLIGGWAVGLYTLQLIWDNLQNIIIIYKTYVFWYIISTGVISFFICYRWGMPTNNRSKNIIKWSMQILALINIYFSSHHEDAAVAMLFIIIASHYYPRFVWCQCRKLWLRKFPPKRRLLTKAEFYEQGVLETSKALNELRSYASSPECNSWRLISRLRDPTNFASFVQNGTHVREDEADIYDSFKYTDDSEDENNLQYREYNNDDVTDDDNEATSEETLLKRRYLAQSSIRRDSSEPSTSSTISRNTLSRKFHGTKQNSSNLSTIQKTNHDSPTLIRPTKLHHRH